MAEVVLPVRRTAYLAADKRRYTQMQKRTDTKDTEDTKEEQPLNHGDTGKTISAF